MFEHLIQSYGAFGVFVGAGVEGETAAFLGGVLAHRHIIAFWQVALAAGLGSFVADQFFFLAGRWGKSLQWVQKMTDSALMSRVTGLLETHPTKFILAFRFIYGMRTISPVAIGLSNIPATRFLILNGIAAAVWGITIPAVGYLFGNAVEALFGRLHTHIHFLIAVGVCIAIVVIGAVLSRHFIGQSQGSGTSLFRDAGRHVTGTDDERNDKDKGERHHRG
ncbi:DedA family protein [Agrobacterium sp. rho-13.3]|uniref:DedA family protein n=1 Tax=Agrobacterium sp. rho-13.3 TaxID=3072980 RepID=UPI003D7A6B90